MTLTMPFTCLNVLHSFQRQLAKDVGVAPEQHMPHIVHLSRPLRCICHLLVCYEAYRRPVQANKCASVLLHRSIVEHNAAPQPSVKVVGPHHCPGCAMAINCMPPVICIEVASVHERGICTAECVWRQIMQVRRGLVLPGKQENLSTIAANDAFFVAACICRQTPTCCDTGRQQCGQCTGCQAGSQ